MQQETLKGCLRALLFAQAWVDGWRPGESAELRGVALLAVKQLLEPGFDQGLDELPGSFVPGLYQAPGWLASVRRPDPASLGGEPLPSLLNLLAGVARYRQPGRLGLAGHLRGKLKRSVHQALVVHAAVLHAVEDRSVGEAARRLAQPDLHDRHAWLNRYDLSLCRFELVLAMHAAQAGGFLLSGTLPSLGALGGPWPPVCLPLAALFCAAQSPASATPVSWIDDLSGEAATLIEAAVFGRGARSRT